MHQFVRLPLAGLFVLFLSGAAVRAEPAAAPAALPVAQIVDETTALVADVDIASVDLEAVRNWMLTLLKQGGLPAEDLKEIDQQTAKGFAMAKTWQTNFTKAGGSHAYILVSISQQTPVVLAFPLAQGADGAALQRSFSKESGFPNDLSSGAAFETVGNLLVMGPPAAVKNAKDIAANPQRAPRPDLAAAFAAGGAAKNRVAFAPAEQIKGAMIIQQPNLPQELGGGATAPLVNAFKYATLTLDTPTAASTKAAAHLTIQARDAEGAQKLKSFADVAMSVLRKEAEHGTVAVPATVWTAITPQVAGDKLVIDLNQEKLESASKMVASAALAARAQAQQMQSMSNMRQILVASIMYSNENRGRLPTKVPEDVGVYLGGEKNAEGVKMIFTNPRTGRSPGYVYVKPAEKLADVRDASNVVTLYEAYEQWPKQGLAVGFVDGHVELVRTEAEFKQMLNKK